MRLLIVISVFNEETVISKVLSQIPQKIAGIAKIQVAVVNDGSIDGTAAQVSKFKNVILLNHLLNRGIGACWQTGFDYARQFDFDIVVTIDGDGQHNPAEIHRLTRPILAGRSDVVLGSRLKLGKMPQDRRILNLLANIYTFLLFGIFVTDSQTGFRAYSKKAFSQIKLSTSRMEAASDIFGEITRKKLKVTEVAVTPIYTEYSRKKGQKNLNAINIAAKLFFRFLTN